MMPPETLSTQPFPDREELLNHEYTLVDILILVAKRKRVVLIWTLVAAILAIVVSLLLPKSYTASVLVLPPRSNTSFSSSLVSEVAGSFGALLGKDIDSQDQTETFIGLLKSRTVEDAVINRFGLKKVYGAKRLSDGRDALESHCDIKKGNKDGMVTLAITDRDPQRAASIANGYMEEYKRLSAHLAVTEAGQRRLFFEGQLEEAKNKLSDAEDELRSYEQKGGILQIDSQTRALVDSFMDLRAQITAKSVEIEAMQSYASPDNPDLIREKNELAALQSQAKQLTGNHTGDVNDLLVSRGNLPAAGLEYIRKYRDVKYYESIFELLAKQYELAKLDEAKEGSVLQIVDSAVVPDKRSFPKRTIIVAVSALIGFWGSILWIFLTNSMAATQELGKVRELKALLRRY